MRSFNKRGYFFIIDAFIAMTILALGLFFILSSYSQSPPQTQTLVTSRNVISYMTETEISSVISEFVQTAEEREELVQRGSFDNSILEQIVEYIYLDEMGSAGDLVNKTFNQTIPSQYNYEFTLIGEDITNTKYNNEKITRGVEEADVVIPSRTLVVVVINQTKIIGPVEAEVKIW